MVPSLDHKAGGVVVVADADAATPTLLLLPFAFAIIPMDGLGQFHDTFFCRTALSLLIVAVVHDDDTGVTMMTATASKTQRQRHVLPGMPPTTIVTRLESTDEEFRKLPPCCFLGVLLVSSPLAVFPEDDVAAFVIDNTVLPASTRIFWGGAELWRPRLQTRHLLTAYFGHPLCQAYVRLGWRAEGGGGQGSLRFLRFPLRRPWFGGVFFVMGGCICVESTLSMVQ